MIHFYSEYLEVWKRFRNFAIEEIAQRHEDDERLMPVIGVLLEQRYGFCPARFRRRGEGEGNGVLEAEGYDIEFCKWVESVHAGKLTGPSSWDGYVACVAGDALNASRGTSQFLKLNTMEKPEIYK